jgi:hypothetical protein
MGAHDDGLMVESTRGYRESHQSLIQPTAMAGAADRHVQDSLIGIRLAPQRESRARAESLASVTVIGRPAFCRPITGVFW